MSSQTDGRRQPTRRTLSTIAITLLVAFALVSTGGTAGAVADSAANADTDIPDPLAEGEYVEQEIDGGETLTYDAELTAGDSFLVVAQFHNSNDIDVSITDPSGETVGQTFDGDNHHGVDLPNAPTTGTYTVEITNNAETASFDFFVEHSGTDDQGTEPEPDSVPEPLETGYYTNLEIDSGETLTYEARLETNDLFQVIVPAPADEVDVRIVDPDGTAVGTDLPDETVQGGAIAGAADEGTYTVEITNIGESRTSFDISVLQETPVVLENGTVTNRLETEAFEYHIIDLAATDNLSVDIRSENPDALDVSVFDPTIQETGEIDREGDTYRIELSDVELDGTYLVQLANRGASPVNYELETVHEGPGAEDPDDVVNGSDTDSEDTETDSDDEETDNDDSEADDGDGVPGLGATSALLALVAATMLTVFGRRSE